MVLILVRILVVLARLESLELLCMTPYSSYSILLQAVLTDVGLANIRLDNLFLVDVSILPCKLILWKLAVKCILEGTSTWRIGNHSFVHVDLIVRLEVKHSSILVHFIPIAINLNALAVCRCLDQVGILLRDLGKWRSLLR